MTRATSSVHRARAVALLLVLGAAVGAARWALGVRPAGEALRQRRERLEAERRRLGETRAELLRLGSDGIATRNRALRAEVERREALAPAGTVESAGPAVRERFAALAARYGVHAPTFEPMPVQTVGGLQIGGMRIRAAGGYHALGTWITESLSDDRLLDIRQARLQAVPDSLTRSLREAAAASPVSPAPPTPAAAPTPAGAAPAPSAPPPAGALELPGAAPLDAIVEFVVQWYALPGSPEPAQTTR
ncbi:MAG TPA: hypothetical protein VF541_08130 [Longimicrobium sp.]|jgi:hypothetical protein